MDWVLKLVRVAGVTNPFTAPFVQLQAEIESVEVEKRLTKLENPISQLHDDVVDIAKKIYDELQKNDSVNLSFEETFYNTYRRGLTALSNKNLISLENILGVATPLQINLTEPSFIMYMCASFEDPEKMKKVVDLVDSCKMGETIDAVELSQNITLPKYVIRAVFQIYESNGFGFCTGGHTKLRYQGKA